MLENHCFSLVLKDVFKSTWVTEEYEGTGELVGMRHLDIQNFSSFMWCQNCDNCKAGRKKGDTLSSSEWIRTWGQVANSLPDCDWTLRNEACLCAGYPGCQPYSLWRTWSLSCCSLLWQWNSQMPPTPKLPCLGSSIWIAMTNAGLHFFLLKEPMNLCEIVEQPPYQSIKPENIPFVFPAPSSPWPGGFLLLCDRWALLLVNEVSVLPTEGTLVSFRLVKISSLHFSL